MRVFTIFIVLVVLLVSACTTKDGDGQNGNSITVDNITLEWHADTLGMLHVTVRAPTTGWIAVGFDPSVGMQDANIIIGYVSGDSVVIRDDYGTGPNSHAADTSGGGADNVSDAAGTETDTTEISFTIPLDSGDTRDRILVQGNSYTVILAYGGNGADDFTSPHAVRTSATIEI